MPTKRDLSFGGRALRRILEDLDKPVSLEHDYAVAILEQARKNAAGKPTPQARMAAAVMRVDRGRIVQSGSNNDPAIGVGMGSEFGSRRYKQFHAGPNRAGFWLYPATRDEEAISAAAKALEEVLKRAVA